jgi:hypothetical protein
VLTDIQSGMAFRGKDGTTRYVIKVHKPGSGYCVTWDSVPFDASFTWSAWYARYRAGRAGQCPMYLFRDWYAYRLPIPVPPAPVDGDLWAAP